MAVRTITDSIPNLKNKIKLSADCLVCVTALENSNPVRCELFTVLRRFCLFGFSITGLCGQVDLVT